MASDLWKLSINGATPVTLSSLGLHSPRVVSGALELGSLTGTIPVADITAAAPFTYGHQLVLYRGDVVHWVGRVRQTPISFSAGRIAWSLVAHDSWWEMERTVYRQPIVVANPLGTGLLGYLSSRITLNQDAWGREINQGQQIANAIDYGSGRNPGIVSLGAVPSMAAAWGREETREITVAEAVRRAASLAPSAYATREYSGEIMVMAFVARASLALFPLDLDDADSIIDVSGLRRRDDIVPPGVVFDFFKTAIDGLGKQRTTLTRQFAGTPGGPGTIYASFNLGPCDTIPAAAAQAYYDALSTAQWEGTIRLLEAECTGTCKPGYRVRITNGQAAWATMDAVVQRVTQDLDDGITTIELGPPDVLGLDDFIGQLNRFRNRPAPTAFCQVQHNGTEGASEGRDDSDLPTEPGEDDVPGVDSPVTGNAPGGGTPAPNSNAGTPAAAAAAAQAAGTGGQMSTTSVTLCDGSTRRFVTI